MAKVKCKMCCRFQNRICVECDEHVGKRYAVVRCASRDWERKQAIMCHILEGGCKKNALHPHPHPHPHQRQIAHTVISLPIVEFEACEFSEAANISRINRTADMMRS